MTNWKPSDAEVDAACMAHACGLYLGIDIDFDQVEGDPRDTKLWPAMTAALTAAHNAAPEPDTTEFEAALHRLVSRAIAYGRGTAEHDAVDVPFQRLIDMYKERR